MNNLTGDKKLEEKKYTFLIWHSSNILGNA